MKIYLASGTQNRSVVRTIESVFKAELPVEFTSTWYHETLELSLSDRAAKDFEGVEACDVLVALYPYGNSGTLQEMAYACALNRHVIYVRPMGYGDDDPLITGLFTKLLTSSKFGDPLLVNDDSLRAPIIYGLSFDSFIKDRFKSHLWLISDSIEATIDTLKLMEEHCEI